MDRYAVGLFLGRFQPFHLGHLYSLHRALEVAEDVVVGIGSANVRDEQNNPLSYEQRKEMMKKVIEEEGLSERVIRIVGIDDFPSDDDWAREVENKVGEFQVVVGNNEWTNGVLEKKGYKVAWSGLHNRDRLEGVKIRELLRRESEEWKYRVPKYLTAMIEKLVVETAG